MAINRLDNVTPARISTNMSIERQTPNRDFGNRLKAGLEATGSAVGSAASVVGGLVPGGAIVSAAVSSVTSLSHSAGAAGGGSGAVTSAYAATGVVNLGAGGGGGINTTVGAGTPTGAGGMPGLGSTVGGMPNSLGTTNSGNMIGDMNSQLVQSQADNAKLLGVQISMQRENQVFSSVSNVLKTRHDTVKNSIGNIH